MNNKYSKYILAGLVAAAFVAGAAAYPFLPDKIASHWNAAGEADGYMGKFWGIFILPFVMLGMLALYAVIPKIDPLKNNIEAFRRYYDRFWVVMFVFFLYLFALTLGWNFGYRFNFTVAIIPAIAGLFYFIGSILQRSKRNWFFGIRTPWTLSSDTVWEKTHKLGGLLFKIAAIATLAGLFLPDKLLVFAIIIPAVTVSAVAIVYSYVIFKKGL